MPVKLGRRRSTLGLAPPGAPSDTVMTPSMTPLALGLALRCLEVLFSGERFDRPSAILADDLAFEGPYHRFGTAQDYIAALT